MDIVEYDDSTTTEISNVVSKHGHHTYGTPSTCGNSVRSEHKASIETPTELVLHPIHNKLDEIRRRRLGWFSGRDLSRNKMFDALDILDVFSGLLELKAYNDRSENQGDKRSKTYAEIIDAMILRINDITGGQGILKLAQNLYDRKMKNVIFEEVEKILCSELELVRTAIYLPWLVPCILILCPNAQIEENSIPCRSGTYRVLEATKNGMCEYNDMALRSSYFFSRIISCIPRAPITNVVLCAEGMCFVNPLYLFNLITKDSKEELTNEEIVVVSPDKAESGILLGYRN